MYFVYFYYVFSFKTKEISWTFKHLKFYESFRPFQIELEIWKWLVFGWEGGCAKYPKKRLLGVKGRIDNNLRTNRYVVWLSTTDINGSEYS